MNRDPAWPSSPLLRRMLYWGDQPGERPHDHVRADVPLVLRQAVAFVLKNGRDAHPDIWAQGWASCRICGAHLGSSDLTAFGFVWPQKAEHYLKAHGVWTPECDHLFQEIQRGAPAEYEPPGMGIRDGRGYGPYGNGYRQDAYGRAVPIGPDGQPLPPEYDFQPWQDGSYIALG